jgi:hypothetical protein
VLISRLESGPSPLQESFLISLWVNNGHVVELEYRHTGTLGCLNIYRYNSIILELSNNEIRIEIEYLSKC